MFPRMHENLLEIIPCIFVAHELPDYEEYLKRALILNDTVLLSFLVCLKEHLEGVQEVLGVLEERLVEAQEVVSFVSGVFPRYMFCNYPEYSKKTKEREEVLKFIKPANMTFKDTFMIQKDAVKERERIKAFVKNTTSWVDPYETMKQRLEKNCKRSYQNPRKRRRGRGRREGRRKGAEVVRWQLSSSYEIWGLNVCF